jgi:hypothetical protein
MVFSRKVKYLQDYHVHILSFKGSNNKSDGRIILHCSAMYTDSSDCIKYVKKTLIDYHQYKEDNLQITCDAEALLILHLPHCPNHKIKL